VKSFWVVTRDKNGKQRWVRLGDDMGIDAARDLAMAQLRLIRNSTDAEATTIVVATSFEAIANKFLELYVDKKGLRSERAIRSYVKRHLIPAFAGMDFADVRRRHITALLDKIEEESGTRTADYTLSVISKMCRWHALRDDDYESPIVPGMKRGENNARDRVLSDAEIAMLWKADGLFGNFTKIALLTLQRADKIYKMKWSDIVDGAWDIPIEKREKGNGGFLRLPQLALDILGAQSACARGKFVFAETTQVALRGRIERDRERFEKVNHMEHWTLHDLRRTGRSLMAASAVPELHAELVMGHAALKGVVGVYNRHEYEAEKGDAMQRLANRIRDIVTPPPSNVEKFKKLNVA
jgi:integrase